MDVCNYRIPKKTINILKMKCRSQFVYPQKKKLEMKKLQKVLKPEEYAATISSTGLGETHGRLASQYLALEEDYRRVIHRMEQDC